MSSNIPLFAAIRGHIARDEDVLKMMRVLLEKPPQLNDVLQQSGRLASIGKQLREGIVSYNLARISSFNSSKTTGFSIVEGIL